MPDWLQDLRYGLRMIGKRPGTSAIAIVALALGIGLTTTMFSIIEGVLLRGLPFEDSDRIMAVSRVPADRPGENRPLPLPEFLAFRGAQTSLDLLAAYHGTPAIVAGETALPERLRGVRITPNLMQALRVAPILGRDLVDADAAPGAARVALISYRQWQSRFGGSPDAVGAVIRLNGQQATVVGVMPDKFGFPEYEDIWVPLPNDAATAPATTSAPVASGGVAPARPGATAPLMVEIIGRARDGVSVERASAEFAAIAKRLAETRPESRDLTVRVQPFLAQALPREIATTFYTMLGAVFGVMLIACVNVTNLQLARAADRTKEFAIRSALGSGRWRIVRQSLIEGLALSIAGAAIGVGLAHVGTTLFMSAIADTQPPFWIDVRIDPAVLLFVIVIVVATTIVSSLAPGLRVARIDANAVLKDDTRGATSVRMGRFGRSLVIVEVTVSCALLVVSGLMVRSILMSTRTDHPFATRDVFFGQTRIEERVYPDTPALRRAIEELDLQAAQVPGVRRAALATSVPGYAGAQPFSLDGAIYARPEDRPRARRTLITPGYFDVLGVSVTAGRLFTAADTEGAVPAAIVDEAFVARHLPHGNALGARVRIGDEKQPWLTIVGVVPSLVVTNRPNQVAESIYLPLAQSPDRGLVLIARTAGEPMAVATALRTVVARNLSDLPLVNVNTLAGELWRNGWEVRVFGGLFLAFGVAALLLAAVGLYGVMSFTVRRRTQEIGVRMALGASRRGVLGLVLWQGLWRVALGVALGLVPGWFLATLMSELLRGVSPSDPFVHVVTAFTLLLAGGLATLVPALRASSVDPLSALRQE
jgi:predicted permease